MSEELNNSQQEVKVKVDLFSDIEQKDIATEMRS